MIFLLVRLIFTFAAVAWGLFAFSGCSNLFNQHAQTMDAMRGVMADTASRLSESGTGQIAAGGQVINPGIRVEGGVTYYASARYEGVAGQVTASMHGGLDRAVPPDVAARINAIWRSTEIADEAKAQQIAAIIAEWLASGAPAAEPAN